MNFKIKTKISDVGLNNQPKIKLKISSMQITHQKRQSFWKQEQNSSRNIYLTVLRRLEQTLASNY